MGASSKCESGIENRAGKQHYIDTLNKNCDAMIASQECFAAAASGFNEGIGKLNLIADETLSNGKTIDEYFDGGLSEVAKFAIAGVEPDGTVDFDTGQNNDLASEMIKWQVGYSTQQAQPGKTAGRVAAYRGETNVKGMELLKEQGQSGLAKSIKSGQEKSDREAATNAFARLQGAIGNQLSNPELTEEDRALISLAFDAAAQSRGQLQSEGMTKCAEDYDKIEQELQTAADDQLGMTMVDMSLSAEEKVAAAEDLIAGKDIAQRGITVDEEIDYNEQCVLLSQIVPLSKFHRNLTMTVPPFRARLPYRPAVGEQNKLDNAPLYVDGEAYGFINKLTQSGNFRNFFNIKNEDLAALQPLIRFYKVVDTINAKKEKKTHEFEMAFDSFATPDDVRDVFQNNRRRGFGVGIKSFDVTFDGQDLFAATRSIKATLKLQANSFDELLKVRSFKSAAAKPGFEIPTYRYVDLALKTGGDAIEKYSTSLNSLNFRLKACFGYNPNVKRANISRGTLNQTWVSVNLTPVTHNFDFDDQGRVTFTIEYYAYVEESLSSPVLSIFTDAVTFSKILTRRLAYQTLEYQAACDLQSSAESEKQKAEREKADAVKIEKEKSCLMNYLMTQLFREDKIYFLKYSRSEFKRVVKEGPFFDFDSDNIIAPDEDASEALFNDLKQKWKSFKKAEEKQDSELDANLTASVIQNDVQVPYLYIGDLIDLIMGNMTNYLEQTRQLLSPGSLSNYEGIDLDVALKRMEIENLTKLIEQYKKFRLTLGPLELFDQRTQRYVNVNFGDVPIAVSHFTEFLTSKLLKKDQAIYPLMQFLKDLFNSLIKDYLNKTTCKGGPDLKQKTVLFESCVTSYSSAKNKGVDRITEAIENPKRNPTKVPRLYLDNKLLASSQQAILNLSGQSSFSMPNEGYELEYNHFIFYAGRVAPANLMRGNRIEDENRGIFHYLLGKDSGIVKNITLSKTNSPGLKEVRFEQEGFKELEQLREVYDVEIQSYANLKALPGTYIFVDPHGFAPNLASYAGFDLTDLGVGGYYMIIRSHHSFGPGTADTRFEAIWNHNIDPESSPYAMDQNAGKNDRVKGKCNATRKRMGLVEIQRTSEDLEAYEPPTDTVSEQPADA